MAIWLHNLLGPHVHTYICAGRVVGTAHRASEGNVGRTGVDRCEVAAKGVGKREAAEIATRGHKDRLMVTALFIAFRIAYRRYDLAR